MNPNDYVKYSFLDQVGKYVAELGITDIGQLDNPKYNSVFERAVERIKTSVNNKPYTPKYDSPNTEILSFLASVTLLSLSNNIAETAAETLREFIEPCIGIFPKKSQ